jgi:hypothetical protein
MAERLETNEYLSKRRSQLHYAKHIDSVLDDTAMDMIRLKNRVYSSFERASIRIAILHMQEIHEIMVSIVNSVECDMMNTKCKRERRKAKRGGEHE